MANNHPLKHSFVGLGMATAYRGALVWFRPIEISVPFEAERFIGSSNVVPEQSFFPEIVILGMTSLEMPFFPFKIYPGQRIQVAVLWKNPGGMIAGGFLGAHFNMCSRRLGPSPKGA